MMLDSSKPIKFPQLWKLTNQLTLNGVHAIEKIKVYTVAFMKARNPTVVRYREKCVNWKKTEDGEIVFFKALANRFWLTSKLISRFKEQQSCLWPTFYQMDFMKK